MPDSLSPLCLRVLPVAGAIFLLACSVPSLGQAVSAPAAEAQAFNARPGGTLTAGTSAGVLPLFPQDVGAPADAVLVPSGNGSLQVIPSGSGSANVKGAAARALKSARINGSGICFQPGMGWVMPAAAASGSSIAAALAGSGTGLSAASTVAQTMMTDADSAGASIQPRAIAGANAIQTGAQGGLCPQQPSLAGASAPNSQSTAENEASAFAPSGTTTATAFSASTAAEMPTSTSYSGGASDRTPWMPKAGTSMPSSPGEIMSYVSSHPFLAPSEIQGLRGQLDDFHSRRQFDDMISARNAPPKKKKSCEGSRDSEEQTGLFADEKEHGEDESCSSSQKSHNDEDTDSEKEKSDGWLGSSSFSY